MSFIKAIISIFIIPICVGFALCFPELEFNSIPRYTLLGLAFGFITNIVFIRLLGSNRLNIIFTLEHELTHFLFSLNPQEIQANSNGTGICYAHHTFISSIAPYFIPLYTLAILFILRISNLEYQTHFQFFIGFFYINFLLEAFYQIFIIGSDDVFHEGFSIINVISIILGNLILFGIILCLLTYNPPIEFIKDGFIQSSDVYGHILEFIQHLLLRAGGEA